MNKLIDGYYDRMCSVINSFLKEDDNINGMNIAIDILKKTKDTRSKIYVIGNGGSAAVAEHAAIDLTKNAGLHALTVSGTPMLTTFSNDYGYENVYKKYIEIFANKNDVLIAISSGGSSANILNACTEARKKELKVITLSGFSPDNSLRKLGDINFWINSRAYGFLEIIHGFILHWMNDSIIGKEEYIIR